MAMFLLHTLGLQTDSARLKEIFRKGERKTKLIPHHLVKKALIVQGKLAIKGSRSLSRGRFHLAEIQ